MCETFHLSFSEEDGIIAWADDKIYEQFSGPAMLKGDFWKIHLGRRIDLDEDDLDGLMFIEGLLGCVILSSQMAHSEQISQRGMGDCRGESRYLDNAVDVGENHGRFRWRIC